MISERLYELAFAYKKTKLWNTIWDKQVFAVKLSGNRIGYVSIMGGSGEYRAVGLYIGEKGFQSFYEMALLCSYDMYHMKEYQFRECVLQQDCLQCAFEGKDDLSDEEREEVKAYARKHQIKLSGKNAYPHFEKYQPNCIPWELETEQEEKDLCEALSAAIALSEFLKEKVPSELGLYEIDENTKEILLLEQQNGEYILGKIAVPERIPKVYAEVKAGNDILVQKVKKLKKQGSLECEIVRLLEPIQESLDEAPVFPVVLVAFHAEEEFMLPIPPILDYEENASQLLDLLMEALVKEKFCPVEIKVCDERTYVFFKNFCKRLRIKLTREEELPDLEEVIYEFLDTFEGNEELEEEQVLEILQTLMEMSEEEREELPPQLRHGFETLLQEPQLLEEIQQIFGMVSADRKEMAMVSNVSYVISVSLEKGCYRHIRISANSTLWELHAAIIDAFEFCDDHAHAFFMDNKKWSHWDAYFMEGFGNGDRTTNEYCLGQVGLQTGMQFKYVFDFGDEWTFQCKVLRILEEDTEIPQIIKRKGNAPEQYGTWWDE